MARTVMADVVMAYVVMALYVQVQKLQGLLAASQQKMRVHEAKNDQGRKVRGGRIALWPHCMVAVLHGGRIALRRKTTKAARYARTHARAARQGLRADVGGRTDVALPGP